MTTAQLDSRWRASLGVAASTPSPTPQPEPSTTRTVTSPLPAKTAALLVLGLICGVALIVFATVVIAAVVVRM